MIVPFSDIIHAFVLPGFDPREVEGLRGRDPGWAVPRAWRSVFRDVVGARVRSGEMPAEEALTLERAVAGDLALREVESDPAGVLREVVASGLPAQQCEFAWLARALGVPLVTGDACIRAAFPGLVLAPADVPRAAPRTSVAARRHAGARA